MQEVGESFDSFLTALRTLAKTCNFGSMQDRMIRDRVVVGIKENSTRKKLLIETKLTLNKCIDICHANENTAKQLKDMTQTEEVSAMNTGKPPNERPVQTKPPPKIKCKFCHRFHLRKKELCPAWQHKCSACGKMNHFSVACHNPKTNQQQQTKRVHNVEESLSAKHDDEDSDEYLFRVESVASVQAKSSPKRIYASMRLRDETVKFQVDCGATVNILPVDVYQKVFSDPQLSRLEKSETTLVMFNQSELKPLGCVKVETTNPRNDQCFLTEYTVVPRGHTALLGAQTVQQFSLITVNTDNIMSVSDTAAAQPDIVSESEDVFLGEGKLRRSSTLRLTSL